LRPYPLGHASEATFYPGPERYSRGAFPDITNRSWTISARLEAPARDDHGVIVTQGGRFEGWALIVRESGKPAFVYRRSTLPGDLTVVEGKKPLTPGPHEVMADFAYDGGGVGKGGELVLKIDGVEVARARLERTVPLTFGLEGAAVGRDTETPILGDYQVPYAYTGRIERVDFKLR
jgi:arylsulfatase